MGEAPRRRILGPLPTILGIVMLAVTATLFVGQLSGFRVHAITTGSMTGTADAGSMAISRFVPTAELVVGDVITYRPPPDVGIDHPIMHRIVDIATNDDGTLAYTTRGDANPTDDAWSFQLADQQQLVMQAAVPHLGRPVLALSDPGTRRIVIGLPALMIAASALLDIVRIWRSRNDDVESATPQASLPAVVSTSTVAVADEAVVERPNRPAEHARPRVVAPRRPVTRVLDLTQFPTAEQPSPRLVTRVVRTADQADRPVPRVVVRSTSGVAAAGNDTAAPSTPRRVVVVRRAPANLR